MNIFENIKKIILWLITQFRNINDAGDDLRRLVKPTDKSKLAAYKKKLRTLRYEVVVSCARLLIFFVGLTMLYFFIAPLTNVIISMIFFAWDDEVPLLRGFFRAGLLLYAIAFGTGALLAAFDKLTGKRKVVVEPSEHDYLVLLKTIFRVIGEIAPVTRLYPPGYAEALKPDTWFRIFSGMPVYIYACHHKGIDLDVSKVCRVFSTELRRQQREAQVSSGSLAALVDYNVDRDYFYFELVLDAESKLAKEMAANLDKKIRRAKRNNENKVTDDEF